MSHSISKVELSGAYFRPEGIVAMQRSSGNEEIILERDHNNQYDENATEVFMVTPVIQRRGKEHLWHRCLYFLTSKSNVSHICRPGTNMDFRLVLSSTLSKS